MHGWGSIEGNNSANIAETVTFPTAFSGVPVVILSAAGRALSSPSALSDFTSSFPAASRFEANNIVAASFQAQQRSEGGTSFSSGQWFAYTWIAIGPA